MFAGPGLTPSRSLPGGIFQIHINTGQLSFSSESHSLTVINFHVLKKQDSLSYNPRKRTKIT